MRELPPHSELIDGNLVFVSPQDQWHCRIISALERGLDEQAPERYEIARQMAVRMGRSQVPEPDLLVISAEAFQRAESTGPSAYYYPDDLLLAIEVESPESLERDRFVNPARYASAGIAHFGSNGTVPAELSTLTASIPLLPRTT